MGAIPRRFSFRHPWRAAPSPLASGSVTTIPVTGGTYLATAALLSCCTGYGCLSRPLWEPLLALQEIDFEGTFPYNCERNQTRPHVDISSADAVRTNNQSRLSGRYGDVLLRVTMGRPMLCRGLEDVVLARVASPPHLSVASLAVLHAHPSGN